MTPSENIHRQYRFPTSCVNPTALGVLAILRVWGRFWARRTALRDVEHDSECHSAGQFHYGGDDRHEP